MEGIKPIETIYNGYRFRSRLEARWAVFFDAMGIKYEYEPEGFDLPSGARYLPDFFLPDHNAYVEIKPVGAMEIVFDKVNNMVQFNPCNTDEDVSKYGEFADAVHEEHNFIVFIGDPFDAFAGEHHGGKGCNYVFCNAICMGKICAMEDPEFQTDNCMTKCSKCRHAEAMMAMPITFLMPNKIVVNMSQEETNMMPLAVDIFDMIVCSDGQYVKFCVDMELAKRHIMAMAQARQARFEFGETPMAREVKT